MDSQTDQTFPLQHRFIKRLPQISRERICSTREERRRHHLKVTVKTTTEADSHDGGALFIAISSFIFSHPWLASVKEPSPFHEKWISSSSLYCLHRQSNDSLILEQVSFIN